MGKRLLLLIWFPFWFIGILPAMLLWPVFWVLTGKHSLNLWIDGPACPFNLPWYR